MRASARLHDEEAPVDLDTEQSVSDEAMNKLLKGVVIGIAVAVIIGVFAGAANPGRCRATMRHRRR